MNSPRISHARPQHSADIRHAGRTLLILSFYMILASMQSARAGGTNYVWDGGGTDDNWNTASNWNPNSTPTFDSNANLQFGGSTRTSPVNNLAGTTTLRRIQFLSGAASFNLTGNAVNIVNAGGIQNSSTNLQTVSLSNIGLGAANFSLDATSGELLINSVLSGTNGFDVTGTRVTLAGTNLHSGANTVTSGALRITNGSALGTTANGTTVSSGAALELQGGITSLAEALAINGTGISTGGALRNISGNNTYTGAITINSATRINSDAGLLTLDVASGNAITGTADNLTFGGAGDISVADVIATTTGTLTKDGTGILTLGAANTYTGTTTVSTGTLRVAANAPSGSSGALGNATSEVVLGVAGGSTDASILINGANTVGRDIRIVTSNTTDAGTRVLTLGGDSADNSVFSGNIFLGTTNQAGRGVTLTAASGGQVTFSGVIQNPTGMDVTTYTVTKSGAGTVVLSGTNTFTGGVTISDGVLSVATIGNGGANSNIGASGNAASNLVFDGGTLRYTGATASTNRNYTINSGKVGTINVSANTLTLSGASVSSNGGLTKTGNGTLTLSGNNLHTGDTIVNAGTLKLDGSGSVASTNIIVGDTGSSGAVLDVTTKTGGFLVSSGKTISGIGTINGNTTIQSGAFLSPGNSPGVLNNLGNISMESGSNFNIELNGATPGTGYDQLNVTGGVTLAGLLNITMGYTPALNTMFFILLNDDTDMIAGTFSNAPVDGNTYTLGGQDFQISYFGDYGTNSFTGGNDVVLMAVPEPGAALLGGLGTLLLLRRRRVA